WQIGIFWRADDTPLWLNPDLLDHPWDAARFEPGSAAAADAMAALTAAIAAGLGVPAECIRPLFEDPLDRLATEARLPAGPPPPAPDTATWPADAVRRQEIVAALDADRGKPAAWAIPLGRAEDGTGWTTTNWRSRRGEVFLRPGTSPAGLR